LLVVLALDLFVVATSRISACVRATAVQGVALGLLPLALLARAQGVPDPHLIGISLGAIALKAVVIPVLLQRTIRDANVRREVEPFVSLHTSLLLGALLVGVSFWLSTVLVLPMRAPSTLLVPVAFATLLLGFFVLVSRKKAITQVVGYLMLENGIFLFGQSIASEMPLVVELGLLLDLLVGVFVFGIAIHHISREFNHIDTDVLTSLRDDR
jgi:hydrogenase-4 component E